MDQIAFLQALRATLWQAVGSANVRLPVLIFLSVSGVVLLFMCLWALVFSNYLLQHRVPNRLLSMGFKKRSGPLLGNYERDGVHIAFISMDSLGYFGWIHTMVIQYDNPSQTALPSSRWASWLTDRDQRRYKELASPWQQDGCDLQIAVTKQSLLAQWRIPFSVWDLLLRQDLKHLQECMYTTSRVHAFLQRLPHVAPIVQ